MRQFSFFSLVVILISLASCKDDFELEAPYADIPLINAYFDVNEDENFVRVQKAFVGVGGNATVSAGVTDSLYYDEEEVVVSLNVDDEEAVELELVNGEDFGLERDTGVFVNTPNLLYRVPPSLNLNGGDRITVTAARPGEPDAVAQTSLIGPITMETPIDNIGVRLATYAQLLNIRWSVSDQARIFNVRMNIRIRELQVDDPSQSEVITLNWEVVPSFRRENDGSSVNVQIRKESFWQFLGNALEEDDAVLRQFLDFDIVVTGVGMEVEESIDLANANGGITSSQSIPVYTNVENGLGIVTSRSMGGAYNLFLEGVGTGDTLRNGIYTRDLGFQ